MDNACHISGAREAYLYDILIKDFIHLGWFTTLGDHFVTLVITFLLNGGLKLIILRFLFRSEADNVSCGSN